MCDEMWSDLSSHADSASLWLPRVQLTARVCTPPESLRLPATWQPRIVTGVPWPDPETMPNVTITADVAAADWPGWVSEGSSVLG